MPSPENGLDYAYTIDHYSHLLSSLEDLPPPPHSSQKFIKKMANYDNGFAMGWKASMKSTNEVYLDGSSMDCSAEADSSGKVNEPSVEESTSEKKVISDTTSAEEGSSNSGKRKDNNQSENEDNESNQNEGKEEPKIRRAKRRKISWKRMNPALFQEIFQWETTQPKVKQSQIEKKFNVNRSTYYRWKKKYLAQ